MYSRINLADFSPTVRHLRFGGDDSQVAVTVGAGSYLVDGEFECSDMDCHILVGAYSSLAHRLKFNIALNHDSKSVSNYNFEAIEKQNSTLVEPAVNPHQIVIGSDVWIGSDVIIMGGVTIGNGAIIGAGAVVAKDIPPYAVAVGNPARVIKYRFSEEIVARLQRIKWWNWEHDRILASREYMDDVAAFTERFGAEVAPVPDLAEARELAELRAAGYDIFAMIPDFTTEERHYYGVVVDYLRTYTVEDRVALLLLLDRDNLSARDIAMLAALLEEAGERAPRVVIAQYASLAELQALTASVTTVITTKDASASLLVDYGADVGARVLYAADLEQRIFSYRTDRSNKSAYQRKKLRFDRQYAGTKCVIAQALINGKYNGAMTSIGQLADIAYQYNQELYDSELEACLRYLASEQALAVTRERDSRSVLFYDAFGYDLRGLAQIYLLALARLGLKITYITIAEARDRIPTLQRIVTEAGGRVLYLPPGEPLEQYRALVRMMDESRAAAGFLYTTPYDVPGVLAFMQFAGVMVRYQIDLTDFRFWLGASAFDYCLEYRNYGGWVAKHFRHIPEERLLLMPYYPVIKDVPFAGFPFERTAGDFVIFSGGFLYKTIDDELTFYRIIDTLLAKYPQVKFWYAGFGDDTHLRELAARHPGRVYHTAEREDFYQLLCAVDMFINTCPQGGGLTAQYAAVAGHPPYVYDYLHNCEDILLDQPSLGVAFDDYEAFMAEVERFIADENYRAQRRQEFAARETVISEEKFTANMARLLTGDIEPLRDEWRDVTAIVLRERELYAHDYINNLK